MVALDFPPPFDYSPRLLVEVSRELPGSQHEALIEEIEAVIRMKAAFAVQAELVPEGSIASEHKTRRVLRNYET